MVRCFALAVFLVAAPHGSRAAAPPPEAVDQAADDEAPPVADETIKPGKRPVLKIHGAPPPTAHEAQAAGERTPSSYKGVTPGGANLPPRPPKLPVAGLVRVTWPGFQVRDGVPTVFVETTSPVEWTVAETPGQLVYTLKGATIPLRNNRRALEVKEFKTAVKQIDARSRGRDVEVTIRLKHKVAHAERTEDAAGGFKLLVVELTAK